MPAKSLPLTAGLILAGGLSFAVTLPEMAASPYYRPYLAAWIETDARAAQGTVAVWYDTRLKDNLGTTFLRELRSWWRATGKSLDLPADGITGPTRAAGRHEVTLEAGHPALAALEPGEYVLAVEVTREDGGRDVLRAPFSWGGAGSAEARGEGEITALSVTTTR
ncbi:DUF2271 domain-containing protein [Pseudogemmobacter faecipullorum]|uniref:DUF2271 domain-containing protein n=1 Tax=Pseudogemmobacter faecipullorum TaxID=2755041 RepID=A0ABS8CND8_9RHOB|nr:DUF2271 domain-containing protein [Pseudogemmobacter faecipullorum]MCB5410899.1 DUF2271 domain-containing protein [Pseudogemmobacter faecipullorum]